LCIAEVEILHQASYLQENHIFQCEIFGQQVSSFLGTVNTVKNEFVDLLEINLSSFEMFVDFVEAFDEQLSFMKDSAQVYPYTFFIYFLDIFLITSFGQNHWHFYSLNLRLYLILVFNHRSYG